MASLANEKAASVEQLEEVTKFTTIETDRATRAARQIALEKGLSLVNSIKIFWRCCLWALYGQLIIFGYGIDANIAGTLIAIPQFRYALQV